MSDLPTMCEIPHCASLYMGKNAHGVEIMKPGKADVFVDDGSGRKRGICCFHYTQVIDRAGKGRMSEVQDANQELTLTSVKNHWDKLAQEKLL